MVNFTPQDFSLPFDEFLPNQGEALAHILRAHTRAINTGEPQFVIISMPVGGGKSALAAAMTREDRVTYLADRHALLDQIENNFGFDKLKGKQVFPCAHKEKIETWLNDKRTQAKSQDGSPILPTASDCNFAPMRKCPFASDCEYIAVMKAALESQKTACTPQLAAFHGGIQKRGGIMFIDEAHNLPEVLGGFVEFSISDEDIQRFGIPHYPFRYGYGEQNNRGEYKGGELTADGQAEDWLTFNGWLDESINKLSKTLQLHNELEPAIAGTQRFMERLQRIKEALPTCPWFLQTGAGLIQNRGRKLGGVVLRPLTVKDLAPNLWREMDLVVLMSATIGDPQPLATELGIEKYEFFNFPHPIPLDARPIYDLGFQRMTHENLVNNPNLYQIQAIRIAAAIKTMPDHWRGFILTSSYEKINQLREFLPRFLDKKRVWKPPQESIGGRLQAFLEDERKGLIHIETMAGASTGFDGKNDLLRFVVVAGINHPNPTDPFVQAKKKYNFNLIMGKVFLDVIQASGRPTRSEQLRYMNPETRAKFTPSDFTHNGFLINKVFIADGSATSPMAIRYYEKTPWFREALVRATSV